MRYLRGPPRPRGKGLLLSLRGDPPPFLPVFPRILSPLQPRDRCRLAPHGTLRSCAAAGRAMSELRKIPACARPMPLRGHGGRAEWRLRLPRMRGKGLRQRDALLLLRRGVLRGRRSPLPQLRPDHALRASSLRLRPLSWRPLSPLRPIDA